MLPLAHPGGWMLEHLPKRLPGSGPCWWFVFFVAQPQQGASEKIKSVWIGQLLRGALPSLCLPGRVRSGDKSPNVAWRMQELACSSLLSRRLDVGRDEEGDGKPGCAWGLLGGAQ